MNDSFYSFKNKLSPFGQKVLHVLVEQLHAEKASINNKERRCHDFTQQNKVFRDSTKGNDSFDLFEPNDQYSRKKCTLKFVGKETPIASTPFELLNYKTVAEKSKDTIMCREDLVNSAIKNSDSAIKNTFQCKPVLEKVEVESIPLKDLESTRVSPSNLDDVSWSNMFDTELFHNNSNERTENNMITIANKLDVNLPEETPIDVLKTPDLTEIKISKRKNSSKATEPKPKKERKLTASNTKNIPRKEKYTKVVKHWLNDVEKNSLISIVDSDTKEPIPTNDKEEANFVFPKIISSKEKRKKNVVQAQLTNKEGKMKFGKPKNVPNDKETEASPDADTKTEKEVARAKKNKSNFVAPIKSQTPVRDVTYDIISLDAHNVETYANTLTGIASSDVFVVIVYRKIIVGVLEANTIVCYEGKNIFIFLSHFDIKINPMSIFDTKIGGALLDPDNPSESFSDLQKLVSHAAEYTIATDCSLQKAAWYMTQLKETTGRLRDLLIANSLWNVFVDVEMRLLPIVADMEKRGVSVDLVKLKSMESVLVTKLKTVEQECHKAAGRQFQVNSPLQVRALLYDELKLDAKCNVKIRETLAQGAKSTSEATLRSLISIHPLPKLILEYRHLHKAHATFLTGIAQHVKDGIVKPTWVQTAAATGRIASNNPNLQAIPKAPFSLVMFPESTDKHNPVLNFRSVYTSRAGYSLLAADFKHVECRVFAHAAADTALLDALRSEEDFFKVLAAKWLSKSAGEVSSADRERTKRIVYASLYGAGARKLMDILDASYEQTLAIAASFNRTFPSLKSFGRGVVSECERSAGRLRTLCGRARTFKDISSQDFSARSHAERQAVNFIVQGSAADLCKLAMILTEEKLRGMSPPARAHLLLQIHDELVWEVHDDDLGRVAATVKEVMEGCGRRVGLARLPVALAAGRSWGEMGDRLLLQE